MARGAAGSEVPGRGGAPGHVGLLMIPLEAKPVAAIDADGAIEGRRGAEAEGDANRGGNAPGPTSQVSQVGPIVEEPAQKASWAIFRAVRGAIGPTPGIEHFSPSRTSCHPR